LAKQPKDGTSSFDRPEMKGGFSLHGIPMNPDDPQLLVVADARFILDVADGEQR
jgi:hypothetical protein